MVSYTVTGSNSGGSVTTMIDFDIIDLPPDVDDYITPVASYIIDYTIEDNTLINRSFLSKSNLFRKPGLSGLIIMGYLG